MIAKLRVPLDVSPKPGEINTMDALKEEIRIREEIVCWVLFCFWVDETHKSN